jgi:hypothetical protein
MSKSELGQLKEELAVLTHSQPPVNELLFNG